MNSFVKIMTTSIKKSENIKLREKKKTPGRNAVASDHGSPATSREAAQPPKTLLFYPTKLALGREPKTRHSGPPKHTNIRNLKKKSK